MLSRTEPAKERRGSPGFTLVELMVVIAVIVVLVGLLLPAVQQARRLAVTVECQSNLRKLGPALATYAQENGGLWPYPHRPGGGAKRGEQRHWSNACLFRVLYPRATLPVPYEAMWETPFTCPIEPKAPSKEGYAMNTVLRPGGYGTRPRRPQVIRRPSETVALMEHRGTRAAPRFWNGMRAATKRHDGSNVLYADFHVDRRPLSKIPRERTDVFWKGH